MILSEAAHIAPRAGAPQLSDRWDGIQSGEGARDRRRPARDVGERKRVGPSNVDSEVVKRDRGPICADKLPSQRPSKRRSPRIREGNCDVRFLSLDSHGDLRQERPDCNHLVDRSTPDLPLVDTIVVVLNRSSAVVWIAGVVIWVAGIIWVTAANRIAIIRIVVFGILELLQSQKKIISVCKTEISHVMRDAKREHVSHILTPWTSDRQGPATRSAKNKNRCHILALGDPFIFQSQEFI